MTMRGGLGETECQTVHGMSDEQHPGGARGGGVPPAHSFGLKALPGSMNDASCRFPISL